MAPLEGAPKRFATELIDQIREALLGQRIVRGDGRRQLIVIVLGSHVLALVLL
jgi:hypothetical protein